MWDLSSPNKDQTCTPCIKVQNLNHWTATGVPTLAFWPVIKASCLLFFHVYWFALVVTHSLGFLSRERELRQVHWGGGQVGTTPGAARGL